MDDFKYVIVIKLYNPDTKPLDCPLVLKLVAEVRYDCAIVHVYIKGMYVLYLLCSLCKDTYIRLSCSLLLVLCMQAVSRAYQHGPPSQSPWRVVLYEQWIGDIALKDSKFAYLQERGATDEPRDVTLIEMTSNMSRNRSSRQMEAALKVLTDMYQK